MRTYCTYFDHHYLPRGLALFKSLWSAGGEFELWVLCLSDECQERLEGESLPGLRLITLSELEDADRELLAVKPTRSIVEYYFTCTPSLVRYVLNHTGTADLVTYLDADLYFFRNPEPIFAEIGDNSVAIVPHRFGPKYRHLESTGIYNVGWVTFRRDANGIACLDWWRERCLEWCYDREEPGRYGDQKYLDQWPERFKGVVVLKNKGINLAPWNMGNFRLTERNGSLWVDDDELIFFHYHGFRQITTYVYKPNTYQFGVKPTKLMRRKIFVTYLHMLRLAQSSIARDEGALVSEGLRYAGQKAPHSTFFRGFWNQLRDWHRLVRCLVSGQYLRVSCAERRVLEQLTIGG